MELFQHFRSEEIFASRKTNTFLSGRFLQFYGKQLAGPEKPNSKQSKELILIIMTFDMVKEQARILAAMYAFLDEDRSTPTYQVIDHNVCSAYVEYVDGTNEAFFCYSNPSALKAKKFDCYNLVKDDMIINKLINRGGMMDLHTEVRLINYLYSVGKLKPGTVVNFFSSRTVCDTCRTAIYTAMKTLFGSVAFMAYEFKVEDKGFTDYIWPITMKDTPQDCIKYA